MSLLKKRAVWAGGAVLVALAVLLGFFLSGRKPFRDLDPGDVASARVELLPPGQEYSLTDEEAATLVSLLNRVVTYQEDGSYTEYAGQTVLFTLQKTDGTHIEVNAFNPFLIIDGVGYRTKYEPCEALDRFANSLR